MTLLMLLLLTGGGPCQEKFETCKQERCSALQGIEWSMCVDKCTERYRKCERRKGDHHGR